VRSSRKKAEFLNNCNQKKYFLIQESLVGMGDEAIDVQEKIQNIQRLLVNFSEKSERE
jgi:hypothetical protein